MIRKEWRHLIESSPTVDAYVGRYGYRLNRGLAERVANEHGTTVEELTIDYPRLTRGAPGTVGTCELFTALGY
jgi:hypothetical protein